MPERLATPEASYVHRREVLRGMAVGSLAIGLASSLAEAAAQDEAAGEATAPQLYPAARNARYGLDRPLTDESYATSYNNFYEYGSSLGNMASRR